MEQPVITFALAKGRLAEQAFDLLEQNFIYINSIRFISSWR